MKPDEALMMLCGRTNFQGQLLSVTWADATHLLFVFADRRALRIPRGELRPQNWTGLDVFSASTQDPVVLENVSLHATGPYLGGVNLPLASYYKLSPDGTNPVTLFSDSNKLAVVRQNWLGPAMMYSHTFKGHIAGEVVEKLIDKNFSIVHDQSGSDVYGWIIEMPYYTNPTVHNRLEIYPLWMPDNKLDFSAKNYRHYALLTEGNLVLADKITQLFEPPKTEKRAKFGKHAPRGWVDYTDGTLYLLDDELGCVFSVLLWARTNLVELPNYGNELTHFMAFGTPFEKFFICLSDVYKKAAEAEGADPNRCDLGGDSESFRLNGIGGPGATTNKIKGGQNGDDDGARKDSIDSWSSGSGSGHLLLMLLFGGGAILIVLLIVGLYKQGFCSKMKKSGSNSHSLKKSKNAFSDVSSKMASKSGKGKGLKSNIASVGSSGGGRQLKSNISGVSAVSSYFPSSISSTSSLAKKKGASSVSSNISSTSSSTSSFSSVGKKGV